MTAIPLPISAPLSIRWSDSDRLRFVTVASFAVVVAAPIMSVVGIPPLPIMWPLYRFGIVLPGCGLTRGVVALPGATSLPPGSGTRPPSSWPRSRSPALPAP